MSMKAFALKCSEAGEPEVWCGIQGYLPPHSQQTVVVVNVNVDDMSQWQNQAVILAAAQVIWRRIDQVIETAVVEYQLESLASSQWYIEWPTKLPTAPGKKGSGINLEMNIPGQRDFGFQVMRLVVYWRDRQFFRAKRKALTAADMRLVAWVYQINLGTGEASEMSSGLAGYDESGKPLYVASQTLPRSIGQRR